MCCHTSFSLWPPCLCIHSKHRNQSGHDALRHRPGAMHGTGRTRHRIRLPGRRRRGSSRLVPEINQAGLSWHTILRKCEAFRRAYAASTGGGWPDTILGTGGGSSPARESCAAGSSSRRRSPTRRPSSSSAGATGRSPDGGRSPTRDQGGVSEALQANLPLGGVIVLGLTWRAALCTAVSSTSPPWARTGSLAGRLQPGATP